MRKIIILFLVVVPILYSQVVPIIDGNLSDAQYTSIATKQNSNTWYSGGPNISEIVYFADATSSNLYIGIKGTLDGSGNAIGLMLNVTGSGSPSGATSGTALGTLSNAWMGGNGGANSNIFADFEVDYGFAFNDGGSGAVYFDAGKYTGSAASQYQGSLLVDSYGSSTTNNDGSIDGSVFTKDQIEWSFNSGGGNNGIELKIPFSQIGATSAMSIEVFAFVVSSTAFFSNITIPGNLSSALGFDPDFSSQANGPYYSAPASPLPVELTSFSALTQNNSVNLTWETATEVNNYGFEIERTVVGTTHELSLQWAKVGFVEGHGNSNSAKQYSYVDNSVRAGQSYSYRLKQIDFDGQFEYSNVVNVEVGVPMEFSLAQNYPNPFNPSTSIEYTVPSNEYVTLKVYDVLGNTVSTLVNENKEAGKYNVTFDASNLTSGIYFYSIQAGKFNQVKKMMLVK